MNFELCHPERSTTASKATRRAQSKDLYLLSAFGGFTEAFFPCIGFSGVKGNSLSPQDYVEPIGILRLRERLRARSAQDDNLRELTTDN